MNKSLILTLALALPLAQAARADDHNNRSHSRPATSTQARFQAAQQQGVRNLQRPSVQRSNPLYPPHRISSATRSNSNYARPVYHRPVVNRSVSNSVGNSGRFRNRDRENNGRVTSNVTGQNNRVRNHSNRNFNRNSFADARNRGVHGHHDRNWWRSHYRNTTFVLFGGGYYYWDGGYWFPAYGYDPYYDNYSYSEPIYGYNDLPPGQVLENVQVALRDLGYYHGSIDGLIGPETRDALAAYQRDNGLVQTAAVDEPTLVTLGLA